MDWCQVCATRHEPGAGCPGELLATGKERYGRRITVLNEMREEVYGVLLAECGDSWRARILTYPNMLWSAPGVRGTIKFVGATPQDAESQAIAFIREHCRSRGLKILPRTAEVESAAIEREYAVAQNPKGARDERHLRTLNVRFGHPRPTVEARTSDLSTGGLFVTTDRPFSQGREVRLILEIQGYSIPLSGSVAWVRSKADQGRVPGMGVQLVKPPPIYVRIVRKLEADTALADADAGDAGDE